MYVHRPDPASHHTGQASAMVKKSYIIISGWPDIKLHQYTRPYWSFKDDMAVIDSVVMKGRCIIIPEALKQQALDQLHVNHMGIENNKIISP